MSLCAVLCLAACAGAPPPPPPQEPLIHALVHAEPGQFGSRPDIPTPEEIHRLTHRQRAAFLRYLDARASSRVPLNRLVFEYLQDITRGFNYRGETFMAADALATGSGNCLSLAILTTALAKLAGVDIGYQLADEEPVFELDGSIVKKGVHVRSILYHEDRQREENGFLVFTPPGIVIDYFPTGRTRFISNVDEDGYLAMYYRNIAAEIAVPGGAVEYWNDEAGEVWLRRIVGTYARTVWLNPVPRRHWAYTPSIGMIGEVMDGRMFPLTLEGLDEAMRELGR